MPSSCHCPPLPVYRGRAFERWLGSSEYTELTVLAIAAAEIDMSFSADTGMAECLVIARKLKTGEPPGTRLLFSSLTHRPQGFAPASSLASKLVDGTHVRQIEDGPYGGTELMIGDEVAAK